MKGPYMFGTVVALPLGVLAAVAGLVLGLVSGIWILFWIGVALAVVGPVIAFGSMALLATRVPAAANEFMQQQIAKELAGGSEPLVGVEIPWKDIVRQVLRVTDFDRKETQIINDKVADPGTNRPYGYLIVESPIFKQAVRIPLIHRDDFWLASSVLDDPQWSAVIARGERELLATYAPRKVLANGFSGGSRALHALRHLSERNSREVLRLQRRSAHASASAREVVRQLRLRRQGQR